MKTSLMVLVVLFVLAALICGTISYTVIKTKELDVEATRAQRVEARP